jgi:hypothetical protein
LSGWHATAIKAEGDIACYISCSGNANHTTFLMDVVMASVGLRRPEPAIFPASATLIEEHARQRKAKAGLPRMRRGRLTYTLQ